MNNFKILLEEIIQEELSSKSYESFDKALKDALSAANDFASFDRKFSNQIQGLERNLKEPEKGKWSSSTITQSLDLRNPDYRFLGWFFTKVDVELEVTIYSNEITGTFRYEISPSLLAKDNNKTNSFNSRI